MVFNQKMEFFRTDYVDPKNFEEVGSKICLICNSM